MNIEPLLSIIVPVYNVEEYLDECVSSIISSNQNDIELILVDDGSPDNCPYKCDCWNKKDSRIKVIHKPNGGLSDARNCGILRASGKYVWFVDSDDWIGKNAITNILFNLKNFPNIDVLITQLMEVKNGKQRIYGDYPPFPSKPTMMSNKEYVEAGYPVLPSVRYIIKRRILIDNNLLFIKGVLHEDIPFCHMLIWMAKKVLLFETPTYYYRIRSGSITTTPQIKSCYSLLSSQKYMKKFMYQHKISLNDKWLVNLTYDYFHEMFIRLYPFIKRKEYDEFMHNNKSYISKEFNKLWKCLPFKRILLLICYNISPKWYSYLLYNKKEK